MASIMKMKITYLFLIALIFIYGCSSGAEVIVKVEEKNLETGEVQKKTQTLNQLAGATSAYYRFDKTHFEKSLEEGKVIF